MVHLSIPWLTEGGTVGKDYPGIVACANFFLPQCNLCSSETPESLLYFSF